MRKERGVDLFKAIEYLRDEKKRLDQLIESIERLGVGGVAVAAGPGRRKMSFAQRREASARMRKYWAARRQQKSASAQPVSEVPAS